MKTFEEVKADKLIESFTDTKELIEMIKKERDEMIAQKDRDIEEINNFYESQLRSRDQRIADLEQDVIELQKRLKGGGLN